MNLTEARDLIDLLLDKADQPYFTTEEKDKFLNLAISDFINMHYQKMSADEDSRRALAGCVDKKKFSLDKDDLLAPNGYHDIITNKFGSVTAPLLSKKYPAGWSAGAGEDYDETSITGHFVNGFEYVLPKQHLYVLQVSCRTWNRQEVLDVEGVLKNNLAKHDIVYSPLKTLKNKSARDFYEDSDDPFNSDKDNNEKYWSYVENRIVIKDDLSNISDIHLTVVTLPTLNQAFSETTYSDEVGVAGANTPALSKLTFAEHYQKTIVQMAVRKMTQVDIGLMTPSA